MNSMTGYGRFEGVVQGYNVSVEIKSVNHRYFTFSPRVPRMYNYLEEKLKVLVHESVSRGEVDLYLNIKPTERSNTVVEIDTELAREYLDKLAQLARDTGIENNMKLADIARFSDIYTLSSRAEDEDFIWEVVKQAARKALEKYNHMRATEGTKLKEDIVTRLGLLDSCIDQVEKTTPETIKAYQDRLHEKIKEVLEDKQVEEARIITEVAIFANKVAVDEEIVRLKSHLNQFREIIKEDDSVGRKLDFLVQEINREANTIGSKSQDADGAKLVVEIKSEVEKIREQIQNIE